MTLLPGLPGLRLFGPVAPRLAEAARPFLRGDLPFRLRAWDGSEAGPEDGPLVELRSQVAVQRMLWNPGELGAAQAYVTGELEVPDDLGVALAQVRTTLAGRGLRGAWANPAAIARAAQTVLGVGALGLPPAPPASQAQLHGAVHSRARDRSAVSFHYDLSHRFYAALLDETMSHSCAYWTDDGPGYGLGRAQRDKLDLVCRKLALEPGMSLLDLGCGFGPLALHAARHYGVTVTAVTLAVEEKDYLDEVLRAEGLTDRVTTALTDYRDVTGSFDAVTSIEMGEHVGERNYPRYAAVLAGAVRPGGRVLVQQISRPEPHGGRHPGGGPFVESFIAPDMYLQPVEEAVAYLTGAGLQVEDVEPLGEHYVRTAQAWLDNLEDDHGGLAELVGEEVVRAWRLFLVGGVLSFTEGRLGADQVLAVRPE